MNMNREIKFRGKRIDNGKWVYGFLSFFYTAGMDKDGFILTDKARMYSPEYCWSYDVWAETVGLFTGFHDQNRKEIYEGDILRFYDNNKEYVCVVGWNNEVGAWCIRFKGEEYFGTRPLGEWIFEYKIEVIGNIYDNKELLEE